MSEETSFVGGRASSSTAQPSSPAQHAYSSANIASAAGATGGATSGSRASIAPSSCSSSSSSLTASITEEIRLKKHLGLMNGVAIIVGIIVGSGIFISPKGVIQEVGSVGSSLAIWGLCGIVCLFGAMCYAELGTAIVKSGADYAYINEAYGNFPSFLYLWVAVIIVLPTGNAITALTFANYILHPVFPECDSPPYMVNILAALCICKCVC